MIATPIDRLMDYLDTVTDQALVPADGTESFQIKDKEQFAWAMRKINQLRFERFQVDVAAEAQLKHVKAWQDDEHKKIDRNLGYFEALVATYFHEQRRENPKLKTLTSPDGAVKARKQQPVWQVSDQAAVVEALKLAGKPELVRVKEEPNLVDLKAAKKDLELVQTGVDQATGLPVYTVRVRRVTEDGEVQFIDVPGVTVADRPEKISVDTEGN